MKRICDGADVYCLEQRTTAFASFFLSRFVLHVYISCACSDCFAADADASAETDADTADADASEAKTAAGAAAMTRGQDAHKTNCKSQSPLYSSASSSYVCSAAFDLYPVTVVMLPDVQKIRKDTSDSLGQLPKEQLGLEGHNLFPLSCSLSGLF